MKGIFTLLALVTVVAASLAEKRWPKTTKVVYTTTTVCPATSTKYEGGHTSYITYLTTSTIVVTECKDCVITDYLPDKTSYIKSEVYKTYTSPCPITETHTVGGKLVYVTYTRISTITDVVPTTYEAFVTLAPVTKHVETEVTKYSTTLCPVTVISTVAGKPVTIIYTSTSVVTKVIPTTVVEYTTALTTCFETTEVFQTEIESVTFYTTVSAQSTIVVTETLTSTIDITKAYTVTSTFEPPTTKATVVIPVTEISSEAVTEVTTVPSERTRTEMGTVVSEVSYTVVATSVGAVPTITLEITATSSIPIPVTTISTPPAATVNTTATSTSIVTPTSAAPVQISGNAAVENRAGVTAMAGVGFLVLLALV